MKFKVCTLASGSKGNSVFIEADGTKILVDAGLTLRETKLRLEAIGEKVEDIKAIIVTHEHGDHVKGIGPIGRACKTPVYMTHATRKAAMGLIGKGIHIHEFEPGSAFDIGGIHIEPFQIPHDAVDPVGFNFYSCGIKAGFATDLGYATTLVIERLKGANLLVIESNHDPEMLKNGPYPWPLKQRVAGREGHLSNEDTCRLLDTLLHSGLSHILLAHLSETNNLPEIAYDKALCALKKNCADGTRLCIAGQNAVSEIIGV
ncbi:MAG TPA: MBL fold metallo-hydrolase [Nitrospirota bacterium]